MDGWVNGWMDELWSGDAWLRVLVLAFTCNILGIYWNRVA